MKAEDHLAARGGALADLAGRGEVVGEDGEDGRKRAVLEDLVAELAGDVGEGPRDEAEQELRRGGVQEAHELGDCAAAGDGDGLAARAGGDVGDHPGGLDLEVRGGVVGEEGDEGGHEVGVEDGLRFRGR